MSNAPVTLLDEVVVASVDWNVEEAEYDSLRSPDSLIDVFESVVEVASYEPVIALLVALDVPLPERDTVLSSLPSA